MKKAKHLTVLTSKALNGNGKNLNVSMRVAISTVPVTTMRPTLSSTFEDYALTLWLSTAGTISSS